MKDRINVEIVRSTTKAHLVKGQDGREGWIQARWLREDGTVSSSTFEKAVQNKTEFVDTKKAAREYEQNFKQEYHQIDILGESESGKAVSVQVVFTDSAYVNEGSTKRIWLPKSQIRDGKCPGWLLKAKAREFGENIIGSKNHFSIIVNSIGGAELEEHVRPVNWR